MFQLAPRHITTYPLRHILERKKQLETSYIPIDDHPDYVAPVLSMVLAIE